MKLRFQIEQARFDQSLFQLCSLQFKLRGMQCAIPRFAVVIPCQPTTSDQPVDQIVPLKRAAQRLFEVRKSEHRIARVPCSESAAQERVHQNANKKKSG